MNNILSIPNIRIKGIEIYHGSTVVDNSYYIEHFKKSGKDLTHFFEDICGRTKRYLIDPKNENSLTMAMESCFKLLAKLQLTGKDIDMIVFSSVLPQYASPLCSIVIHNVIDGKEDCFCHDINTNCAGMIYSLDYIYRYMSANNKINKALLIGSDFLNFNASSDNEFCYGQFGDASCSVIIERSDEDCGLIDSKVTIHSDKMSSIIFPKCGFSNIFETKKEDIVLHWSTENSPWLESGAANMRNLLAENNLTPEDVSMFCLSQYKYSNIEYLKKNLNIPDEKCIYIGDTYGYTGTTSPFIALYEAINNGQVHRGDYVMLWTVAPGYIHICVLIKY